MLDEETITSIKEIATMKADLKNTCVTVGEIKESLFGKGGIEKRLRKVEVKQGIVAGGIAVILGLIEWFRR